MEKLKNNWQSFKSEYGWKAILDSLFAGVVYGMLIFIPIYIILVEITMIYMYRLYTFVVLIIFAAMLNGWVINKLACKALVLKKPDHTSNPHFIMLVHAGFWMSVILILGLIFIFVLIPILWV